MDALKRFRTLYETANVLCAEIGAMGVIRSNDPKVINLMMVLGDIDDDIAAIIEKNMKVMKKEGEWQ